MQNLAETLAPSNIKNLIRELDQHDCHLSPMDSCDCQRSCNGCNEPVRNLEGDYVKIENKIYCSPCREHLGEREEI